MVDKINKKVVFVARLKVPKYSRNSAKHQPRKPTAPCAASKEVWPAGQGR